MDGMIGALDAAVSAAVHAVSGVRAGELWLPPPASAPSAPATSVLVASFQTAVPWIGCAGEHSFVMDTIQVRSMLSSHPAGSALATACATAALKGPNMQTLTGERLEQDVMLSMCPEPIRGAFAVPFFSHGDPAEGALLGVLALYGTEEVAQYATMPAALDPILRLLSAIAGWRAVDPAVPPRTSPDFNIGFVWPVELDPTPISPVAPWQFILHNMVKSAAVALRAIRAEVWIEAEPSGTEPAHVPSGMLLSAELLPCRAAPPPPPTQYRPSARGSGGRTQTFPVRAAGEIEQGAATVRAHAQESLLPTISRPDASITSKIARDALSGGDSNGGKVTWCPAEVLSDGGPPVADSAATVSIRVPVPFDATVTGNALDTTTGTATGVHGVPPRPGPLRAVALLYWAFNPGICGNNTAAALLGATAVAIQQVVAASMAPQTLQNGGGSDATALAALSDLMYTAFWHEVRPRLPPPPPRTVGSKEARGIKQALGLGGGKASPAVGAAAGTKRPRAKQSKGGEVGSGDDAVFDDDADELTMDRIEHEGDLAQPDASAPADGDELVVGATDTEPPVQRKRSRARKSASGAANSSLSAVASDMLDMAPPVDSDQTVVRATPLVITPETEPQDLRRGKWSPLEESFVAQVMDAFSKGILPLPDGTSLRNFLATQLRCAPMRISKKYAGDAAIGKKIYRHNEEISTAEWQTASSAAVATILQTRERMYDYIHAHEGLDLRNMVPAPFDPSYNSTTAMLGDVSAGSVFDRLTGDTSGVTALLNVAASIPSSGDAAEGGDFAADAGIAGHLHGAAPSAPGRAPAASAAVDVLLDAAATEL